MGPRRLLRLTVICLAVFITGGVGYLVGRHVSTSHQATTQAHRVPVSTHQQTTTTSDASSTTTESSAPTTTSTGPTEVDVFAPWTPDDTLSGDIKVLGHLADGNCWERSISDSSDPDAWRCTSGNEIVDPCFAPSEESDISTVACAQSPWAGVEMLSLSRPLAFSSAGSGPGTG
jgi:eukaryotic-like serine/threonine-protein kinase